MSVIEKDKIDAIGKNKEKNELMLMIADDLDWENEYEHLMILQDKINSYLGYIEAKQFSEVYQDISFKSYLIEIHFKTQITTNCSKFLETVSNQLIEHNIKLKIEIVE